MRVLVTGGAGYIGSATVRYLLAGGHDVWAYDNLSRGHRGSIPADRLIVGDLLDAERLDHALLIQRIEAVIHFAALAYVGESVENPGRYYVNNVAGSLTLLERMRKLGIARLVFSSTCATYGTPSRLPIDESEPQAPINPYGRTKLHIEHALRDYAAGHGIGAVALRYFNAAGAAPDGQHGEDHSPETHLIPLILQAIQGQRPAIEIFGSDYPTRDGTCIRDYIHIDDLARAHLLAMEKCVPGEFQAYNLGTGHGYTVREVIRTCEQVTGKPVPLRIGPRRPGDPAELVAANSLARSTLGWEPRYRDLQDIVETAWRWHRARPQGYA